MIEALSSEFEVLNVVARGGMGVVYKARQLSLDRIVAIKMLSVQGPGQEEFIERFKHEARTVAGFNHQNIVHIHDIREAAGTWFIISEFVSGGSLRSLLMEKKNLPIGDACRILRQVCSALDHAHAMGVVHRDIKPDNVLFTETMDVKIADFGIARSVSSTYMTNPGLSVGTPCYMSPEQASGDPLDHRSDVYSMGVLLFEMLTGTVPFNSDNPMVVMFKHLSGVPPRPSQINKDLPAWVDGIVLKCMTKKPEGRFQTAKALVEALEGRDGILWDTQFPSEENVPDRAITPRPFTSPTGTGKTTAVERQVLEIEVKIRSMAKAGFLAQIPEEVVRLLDSVKQLLVEGRSPEAEPAMSKLRSIVADIEERAQSPVVQISVEDKVVLLGELSREWGCMIDGMCLRYLADRAPRGDKTFLAETLQRLISTSLATGQPVSVDMIDHMLSSLPQA